jgi:hypothetical protein
MGVGLFVAGGVVVHYASVDRSFRTSKTKYGGQPDVQHREQSSSFPLSMEWRATTLEVFVHSFQLV